MKLQIFRFHEVYYSITRLVYCTQLYLTHGKRNDWCIATVNWQFVFLPWYIDKWKNIFVTYQRNLLKTKGWIAKLISFHTEQVSSHKSRSCLRCINKPLISYILAYTNVMVPALEMSPNS